MSQNDARTVIHCALRAGRLISTPLSGYPTRVCALGAQQQRSFLPEKALGLSLTFTVDGFLIARVVRCVCSRWPWVTSCCGDPR